MLAIDTDRARTGFPDLVKDAAAGQQYYVLRYRGSVQAVLLGYDDWRAGCANRPVDENLQQTRSVKDARDHLSQCRTAAYARGIHTLLTSQVASRPDTTDTVKAVLAPYPWVIDALGLDDVVTEPEPTATPTTTEPDRTLADALTIDSVARARAKFSTYVRNAAAGHRYLLRNRGRVEAVLLGYNDWRASCKSHPVGEDLQQTMALKIARDHLSASRTAAHTSGIHTLITSDADKHTDPSQALKAVIAPYPWALDTLNAGNPGTS